MPKTLGEQHLEFWSGRLDRPSFVYVIQGKLYAPIKVGRARNPLRRLASLQTGNPDRLSLLYVLPGGAGLERHLQRRAGDPCPGGDEWFHPDAGFLRMVKAVAERAVKTYDDKGLLPFYPAHPEWDDAITLDRKREARSPRGTGKLGRRWRTSREPSPVKVTFTEPNPVTPIEEARQARHKLSGRLPLT